jgi:hypothetical protein
MDDAIAVACVVVGIMPMIIKLMNPETPAMICILLVVMSLVFVYPILHFFQGFRHRVLSFVVVYSLILVFGVEFWPRQPTVSIIFENNKS